jgi:Methyltransferase domain
MPSIEENLKAWGNDNRWSKNLNDGYNWSSSWGNVDMHWYGSLLPRLQKYLCNSDKTLKVNTILEIAPGYGRWTQYLQFLCEKLIVVDLNANCIQACQDKFLALNHIEYHVNDGKSLSMISDNSINFVFSHDSLVHVEFDIIDSYLSQLSTKLKPDGVGFIHHSNLGNYLSDVESGKVSPHWRAKTVTFEKFKLLAEKNGLICLSQELFNWGNKCGNNIDCFSVFTKKSSRWVSDYRIIKSDFITEVNYIKNLSTVYA